VLCWLTHRPARCEASEGEARRDDENFAYVANGEHNAATPPTLHKEPLEFATVKSSTHSYD